MLPITTILHPTDFSDASAHALRFAEGLAVDYGALLIILHAVEPTTVLSHEDTYHAADTELYRRVARERVSRLVGPGSSAAVESVVSDGIAASEIVRVAADRHCDLIVIGSHGRSGLGRVLMGSVTEEVARRAPCPVLIVRSPHELHHAAPAESQPAPAPR